MTDIDVSKIKPGDLVKIEVCWGAKALWLSANGWHRVTEEGGCLRAADVVIRNMDGSASKSNRVRKHKPAPQPIPTEPGTRFRATVLGVPDQIVTVLGRTPTGATGQGKSVYTTSPDYITARAVKGCYLHTAEDITGVHDVVLP